MILGTGNSFYKEVSEMSGGWVLPLGGFKLLVGVVEVCVWGRGGGGCYGVIACGLRVRFESVRSSYSESFGWVDCHTLGYPFIGGTGCYKERELVLRVWALHDILACWW